jgi:hypothetical protein
MLERVTHNASGDIQGVPATVRVLPLEPVRARDSAAIARKGTDWETLPKPSQSDLTALNRTRVPDSDSIGAILAHARVVWGTMRVI